MDLVSWSLNAIDQIFSTLKLGKGEPACPAGTYPSGYTMDSWSKWKIVCLSMMSVEDVEDIYIIGVMIIGFLLFGLGGFLMYRKEKKLLEVIGRLLQLQEGLCRAVNTQTNALNEQNRKLDAVLGLVRGMGNNLEKLLSRADGN